MPTAAAGRRQRRAASAATLPSSARRRRDDRIRVVDGPQGQNLPRHVLAPVDSRPLGRAFRNPRQVCREELVEMLRLGRKERRERELCRGARGRVDGGAGRHRAPDEVRFSGSRDAVDRVVNRNVQNRQRPRAGGGGVFSERMASRAAAFHSVTTSARAAADGPMSAAHNNSVRTRGFTAAPLWNLVLDDLERQADVRCAGHVSAERLLSHLTLRRP